MMALILATAAAPVTPAGAASPTTTVADVTAVKAVWVDSDLSFSYMGFTTHYSCDGIRDKTKYVLRELGARPDFRVTVSGCVNVTGPEVMPRVRVRAAFAQEATPELLEKLAKAPAPQAPAAKKQAKHAATTADSTKPFPATWRTVQFRGTAVGDLEDGDCEFMDQVTKEVLVPMGVRQVAGSSVNCVPHQIPLNAVDVKLQVLQPATPVVAPGK
jgi:hypothetical protein